LKLTQLLEAHLSHAIVEILLFERDDKVFDADLGMAWKHPHLNQNI